MPLSIKKLNWLLWQFCSNGSLPLERYGLEVSISRSLQVAYAPRIEVLNCPPDLGEQLKPSAKRKRSNQNAISCDRWEKTLTWQRLKSMQPGQHWQGHVFDFLATCYFTGWKVFSLKFAIL